MKLAPIVCVAALERAKSNAPDTNDDALRASITKLVQMTHTEDISVDVGRVFLALLEGRIETPNWSSIRPLLGASEVRNTLESLFAEKSLGIDEVRARCGTSFLATESAAYGLSLLMLHGHDFRSAVLAAINGGGDTDTNASIVGALVGAHLGLEAMPKPWNASIPDASEAVTVADQLIHTFLYN